MDGLAALAAASMVSCLRYSPGDVGLKIYVSGINVVQPKATLPSIAEFLGKYQLRASLKHPLRRLDMVGCCFVVAGLRFVLTCPSCSKVSCSREFGRDLLLSLSNLCAKSW